MIAPARISVPDPFFGVVGDTAQQAALRHRLRRARDIGGRRAASTHSCDASDIFSTVERIAGFWIWKRADADTLKEVADSMVRLFLVATALESREAGQ